MAKQLFTALAALAALVAGRKYNTSSGVMTGALNIHLVPHTHDDVGYVKTMDQYFWGANFSVQNAGVQWVLDSVLDALRKNPDRRFIYVEQAFFDMWWRHADAEDQAAVRALVASGQLELINGGWVMHDEAGPSYVDMIDQTTLGVRNIKTRFNVAPKVTWQIDPFGHSGVQSSLLTAASGYLGLFPGRADYQDVAARQNSSSLGAGHRVRLDANLATAAVAGRSMMQDLLYPPRQAWTPLPEGTAPVTWLASHKARYQGLAAPLASNVHLLTVHSYSPTSLLLRLAHLYSIDDPAPASSNATVDMAGLFSDFQILQAQEMNLIANMDLQEVQDRYSSVGLGHMAAAAFPGLTHPPSGPGLTVSLAPMQIRTFLCSTTPQGAQLQTKAVTMGS